MSTIQGVLTIIGILVTLATVGGGVWAVFRTGGQEMRITRLSAENEEYLRRLNYLEPRVESLEKENKLLLALHNPADQIKELKEQEQTNHEVTLGVLQQIHGDLSKGRS